MRNRTLIKALLILTTFGATNAYSGVNEARNIARTAQKAKNLVSRILASGGHQPGSGPVQPGFPGVGGGGFPQPGTGGGTFPWQENDALALPMFMQASGQLNTAANYAFESLNYFLSGNISMGNFKFVSSCSRLAISKSALSRANFAAIQPPVGVFGVFNAEVFAMLNEIENARVSNGCL